MGMLISRRRASFEAKPAAVDPGPLPADGGTAPEGDKADLSDDDDSGDESDGASTGSRKRKKS